MAATHRRRSWSLLACAAALLSSSLAAQTSAATDTTPPVGTVEYWSLDRATYTAELRFSYSDPESSLTDILVACDGEDAVSYPYTTRLFLPVKKPEGLCTGYGQHLLRFAVRNSAGLVSQDRYAYVDVNPYIELETPRPAITGEPFTIRPIFPDDYVFPPTAECVWEFRWGSETTLLTNDPDGTFGGLYFKGPAGEYCQEWTFTLPWTPLQQYQVSLSYAEEPFTFISYASIGLPDDGLGLIKATVGTTSRHISNSTIPLAYILPDKDVLVVGESVTFTRYLVHDPQLEPSKAEWVAHSEGESPSVFEKTGGGSFTFAPDRPGVWIAGWMYTRGDRWAQAYYDPIAKRPDSKAPTVTKPAQRVGAGTLGTTVPVKMTWSGADSGSGVDRYVLQRSKNGGAWTAVTLPSPLTTSVTLPLDKGNSYRFRVRAVDKAGNRSAWLEGPTFKPAIIQESNTNIRYVSSWSTAASATASGGAHRLTASSTARANYTFSGRDVAWVAETGPGRARVDVYVDGSFVQTVDLYAASVQPRKIVFSRHWSAKGTHTISLRNRATTGRPQASLDAIVLLR